MPKKQLLISQMRKIADLAAKIPASAVAAFNEKFAAWKATWTSPSVAIFSGFRKYAESKEYADFLALCKQGGKMVWPLLIQNLAIEGNFYIINAVEDIIAPGNGEIMQEVRSENLSHLFTADGAIIVYTPQGNWLSFCKKILDRDL
jgi:hypothetical protein